MKVLLISPTYPTGGISTWTKKIINSAYSDSFVLLDTKKKGKSNFMIRINDIITLFRVLNTIAFINDYDIVHINSSCSSFGMIREIIWIFLLKIKKNKICVQYHCDVSNYCKESLERKMLKILVKNSDLNLVLNHQSKKFIDSISKENSIIFPNFLDDKEIVEYQYTPSIKIKKILFIGRICEEKGVYIIEQIAERMADIDFFLIGPCQIKEKIKGHNIHFKDSIEQSKVIKTIKEYDLVILPSYSEGFPMIYLESMVAGVPVITNNVGAANDVFSNNEYLIFHNNNIDEIIRKIEVLNNKELRVSISKNNYIKVKEEYSLNQCVNKLINTIYLQIL